MRNLQHTIITAAAILFLASILTGCGNKGGKLTAVTISPAKAMVAKGTKQQFTATAIFSDGTTLDWSSAASWSSSNQSAVTIGNDFGSYGMATSLLSANTGSVSTIIITATDLPNNISGRAILTVVDPVSLTIKPANPFMAINTGHQFTAEASLSNGTDTVVQNLTSHVTWTTADRSIATVNGSGNLTTFGPGTTEIKVLYSSASGTTILTSTAVRLQTITVSPPAITIVQGNSTPLTAKGTMLDAVSFDFTESVRWSSSNKEIADFNTPGSEGLVTAGTKTGTVTVQATDPITGESGISEITVITVE